MASAKRKRAPKESPNRPDDVPDAARWNAHEEMWAAGWSENGKRTGPWTFYFADGGVAGHANYVGGLRDGVAVWFHRNKSADLREQSTYVGGKFHGKRIWQRSRKGKTPGFEWFDKLGAGTWRYEVPHWSGAGQPRWAAFYGKLGTEAQVPCTAEGRSVELGEHLEKLEPQTVLILVEESFIDCEEREVHDGSLARIGRGAKTIRGRYLYMGRTAEDVYELHFMYDDTQGASLTAEYMVDANELSRAFTLAVDYYPAARLVFDTPRKR